MKPKYIFSAVLAVSILLSVLLPSIGTHRVKVVEAAAGPASSTALPAIIAAHAAAQPTPMPTLAPFKAGNPQATQPAETVPVLPPAAQALSQPANDIPQTALPDLKAFAASFRDFPSDQVTGTYVQGLFALPVVQQPVDNPDYVSPDDNTLTQFVKPERFGVIGLLAHNYLSGKPFAQLQPGQDIFVIYGGDQTARFHITAFQHYQAVDSQDINTDYVDLDDQQAPIISQQQVFDRAYTHSGQLVLQTCIEKNGDYSWGRLFVIATPD